MKGLIPQSKIDTLQIPMKTDGEKARELVQLILMLVDDFPVNYEVFLGVVDEHPWLKNLAKLIRERYNQQVKEGMTKYKSDNKDFSLSPTNSEKKFPYLKMPKLSEEKKESLLGRLKVQSDDIRSEFAILVDKTRGSLIKQGISSQDLKLLIEYSNNSRLYNLFEKEVEITDLFFKLRKYLSFFDYEFVGLIIKRHCPELTNDLENYKSALKIYCKRRAVEVPADVFKREDADETSLFVKCDKSFESVILNDIKDLQSRLSELLGTDLYLLRVDDGCTELVFDAMCPIFPLIKSQRQQLSEMGILKVYSIHYKNKYCLPSEKPAKGTASSELTVSVQTDEPLRQPVQYSFASTQTYAQYEPPSCPAWAAASEFDLSEDDIKYISKEIEEANKVEELAEVLKITRDINGNGRLLLEMWQKAAASRGILQRPHLSYCLDMIGLGYFNAKNQVRNLMSCIINLCFVYIHTFLSTLCY